MSTSQEALKQLDESPMSGFHFKTVITAGMGFFTDAYDLFIIGVVTSILKDTWHINSFETSMLSSVALLASVLGAIVFGRIADTMGRKFIYGYELLVLAAGAIASALAPNIIWLLIFRFVLGVGIGGDYPVSSTLMSEYSNRKDRGKLITFVFSTQALGLIIGPLLTYILLQSGVDKELTWRLILGVGAIPALATFWLRRQISETPRFALAQGDKAGVTRAVEMAEGKHRDAAEAGDSSESLVPTQQQPAASTEEQPQKTSWKELFTVRHWLIWLIGAAGTWFLLDIAYYGTTVSTPIVIKLFSPKTSLSTNMLYTLLIFVVAALPGYILAAFTVDRLGRKPIQLIGFAVMALSYGVLFIFPQLTTVTIPFLLCYGLAYLFTEFGPNVTTFLYPAEIFPVTVRTTAHGLAAGLGKFGAFIGAFVFPLMLASPNFKLPGAMGVAAIICLAGFFLTFVLPEPKQKSLETIEKEGDALDEKLESGKDQTEVSA
ncbi:MFS transporter [Dictyobacter kobayashii]|uniref:MFS transporter n=1 Tax=Dictyobacter kobayashii TaxID=2014872 RepID=A0A402ACT0_9CHLR|nr:MFS transporter [Dictyobacter kobayashii]GCE16909.1 MFS transporter [Dictyobacter kobayashii]